MDKFIWKLIKGSASLLGIIFTLFFFGFIITCFFVKAWVILLIILLILLLGMCK